MTGAGGDGSKDWIRCSLRRLLYLGRSKFRRTHRCGVQRMPQCEPDIPDPLSENEPEFLAPGGLRTPTVRILFFVFISQHGFKRSAMQVQSNHIGRSERAWWQGRVEQLVDALTTGGADLHRSFRRRPCSDDDPCTWSRWRKSEIREVEECSTGSRGADEWSAGLAAAPGELAPLADPGDRSPCRA